MLTGGGDNSWEKKNYLTTKISVVKTFLITGSDELWFKKKKKDVRIRFKKNKIAEWSDFSACPTNFCSFRIKFFSTRIFIFVHDRFTQTLLRYLSKWGCGQTEF